MIYAFACRYRCYTPLSQLRRSPLTSFLPTPLPPLGPTPHLLTSTTSIVTSGKSNPQLFPVFHTVHVFHTFHISFHASLSLWCVFEINFFSMFTWFLPIGQQFFFHRKSTNGLGGILAQHQHSIMLYDTTSTLS